KESMLFSEVSEGFNTYGVGHHRHMAELDQEFSAAAGKEVIVSFTPHLVPMNRGILSTIYVKGRRGKTPEELHEILLKFYAKEPFVHVLPFGETPHTRHVRGSNMTFIGVAKDRQEGRAIVIAALDNLVKGASGQAVQNMNLIMGWPEPTGIDQVALFPCIADFISLVLPGAFRKDEAPCSRSRTSRRRSRTTTSCKPTPRCARRCGARVPTGPRAGSTRSAANPPFPRQSRSALPPTAIRRSSKPSTATATASTRSSSTRPGTRC